MPDLIGWAAITDLDWRPPFKETKSGLEMKFTGSCPRCEHPTLYRVAVVQPNPSGRAIRGESERFTVLCRCGYPHPGHPEGDNSCGAYWQLEMTI